jgi:putative cardiolipin synthase
VLLEIALGGWHLNRRMHNKAWIADGCLAVLGGRNLGDEYFGLESEGVVLFRDLDLAIAGAAAREASVVFARYWASPLARPAAEVAAAAARPGALAELRASLDEAAGRHRAAGLLAPLARAGLRALSAGLTPVGVREVRVVADPPEKARRGLRARRLARTAGGIAADIADALRGAREEALLISPYFVPGAAGLGLLRELRARGVRVAVVTNSLAATDVVAAHGGYARYRPALLAAGVALYELRPGVRGERPSLFGSRGAALHTKALAVDRSLAFVGSFNLDPRSAALNTEMGAFVRCAAVAEGVAAEHARLAAPALSWELRLEGGRLAWFDPDPVPGFEPLAGWGRRALAALIRRLPVEDQL